MVKFTVSVIIAAALASAAFANGINDAQDFSSRDVAEQPDLFGRAAVKVMNDLFSREELSDLLGRDVDELEQRDFDELMEREIDIEDDLLTRQIESSDVSDLEARGFLHGAGTMFKCNLRFLFNKKKRNQCRKERKAKWEAQKAAKKAAKEAKKSKKSKKTKANKTEESEDAAAEEAREFGDEDLEARGIISNVMKGLGTAWQQVDAPGKPAPTAAAPAPAKPAPAAAAPAAPAEGGDAAPAAREFDDFEDFAERDYDEDLMERDYDDFEDFVERDYDEGEFYERDFDDFDIAEREFDDEDFYARAYGEYDELD